MKVRKVHIDECTSDARLAEHVHNEFGAVIIPKGTSLNSYIKDKLKSLGFTYIKTYVIEDSEDGFDDSEVLKAGEEIRKVHSVSTYQIRNIVRRIYEGEKPDIKVIDNVTKSIVEERYDKGEIIRCVNEIRSKDEYTYQHMVNVSMISMLIAGWLKLSDREVEEVAKTGLIHDLGKARIPLDILNKPGSLNEKELSIIKKHPVLGYRLIEKSDNIGDEIKKGVLMHHERNDGSGYPVGVKDEKISLYAKIVAVADIFDAMTSERVYKRRMSPFYVFEMMKRNSFGVLDTEVLHTFLKNITVYYIGDRIRLNNGKEAEIIYINPLNVSRPIIRTGGEYVDLSSNLSIEISPY